MNDNTVKSELREYRGFRYVIKLVKTWRCGYVLIDEKLFKNLELGWYRNHTSSRDGEITYIQNREDGDKDFENQNKNEIYFGIDTNHTWSHNTSDEYVDSIMKEWIDWIVENKESKLNHNYNLILNTIKDLKMSVNSLEFIVKDLNVIKDDDLLDTSVDLNYLNQSAKFIYTSIHRLISKKSS
ncbi:TPA: hypothetical protein RTG63_001684 [Campylobacter jejuni]|nr:hypothetical protein [Campylobacter jejuni]